MVLLVLVVVFSCSVVVPQVSPGPGSDGSCSKSLTVSVAHLDPVPRLLGPSAVVSPGCLPWCLSWLSAVVSPVCLLWCLLAVFCVSPASLLWFVSDRGEDYVSQLTSREKVVIILAAATVTIARLFWWQDPLSAS